MVSYFFNRKTEKNQAIQFSLSGASIDTLSTFGIPKLDFRKNKKLIFSDYSVS